MPAQKVTSAPVRFGVFELDPSGQLRKSGVRIHLTDQPLQVLTLLLERPGELVTRDELRARLWPHDTFVDFDHSLNSAVNKLRDALGDSASSARFIETVPRRGYRFVAPLESLHAPTDAPLRPRRWGWLAVAALALVAVAVLLAYRKDAGTVRTPRPVPLTAYAGDEYQPTFSPDGNQVAFVWTGEDGKNADIYVKVIGSDPPLRLTSSSERDENPAWSPHGRWIAFTRAAGEQQCEVFLISPVGGPERRVGDLRWCLPARYSKTRLLAWLPDSRGLVVSDRIGEEERSGLFTLDAESGARRQLTSPPAGSPGDHDPAVSPDGSTLAFATRLRDGVGEIYRLPLSREFAPAGEPVQVTTLKQVSQNPAWTPDGQHLVFRSGPHHLESLARIHAYHPDKVEFFPGYGAQFPVASLSKPRLAYTKGTWDVNIWSLDLPRPAASRSG